MSPKGRLFTVWSCDGITALMQGLDIFGQVLRGAGVGVDVERKVLNNIRFLWIEILRATKFNAVPKSPTNRNISPPKFCICPYCKLFIY